MASAHGLGAAFPGGGLFVPPRIERLSIQHKPLGRGVAATGRAGGVSLAYIQPHVPWQAAEFPQRKVIVDDAGWRSEEGGLSFRDLMHKQIPPDIYYPATYPALAHSQPAKNLTDTEIDEVLELSKWACEELNLGPHAYQACALTT